MFEEVCEGEMFDDVFEEVLVEGGEDGLLDVFFF